MNYQAYFFYSKAIGVTFYKAFHQLCSLIDNKTDEQLEIDCKPFKY